MPTVTMVHWQGEHFWLGKILEHPEIMSQGETIEELEDHLRDAYRLPVLEDVLDDAQTKELRYGNDSPEHGPRLAFMCVTTVRAVIGGVCLKTQSRADMLRRCF